MDEWTKRLSDITVNALPIAHSKNKDAIAEACLAVSYGVMDMAPADPVRNIDRAIDGGKRGRAGDVSEGLGAATGVFPGPNEIPSASR